MNQIPQNQPVIEEIELTPLSSKGELVTDGGLSPDAVTTPFLRRHALFLATVVLPVAIAAIYYFLIAADRYQSEARFIVRSASSTNAAGVTAMIENQGLSRATDETYAVNDYVTSRDIVDLLVATNNLREILARPEADFINRYPNFYTRSNKENLYERYRQMVSAQIDGETGISTVSVQAFRPNDAQAVVAAILGYAEGLINRLNERAYDDAERYAQQIVEEERAHVSGIQAKLTAYRNGSGTVDPGKEAAAQFELIGKMTTELALLSAEVQQQSMLAPSNPGIPAMRERVRSYQAEIDKQKLEIVGSNKSLATRLETFERLVFEREMGARALGLAMVNLCKAREDAQQQHLYLQTIVVPNAADEARFPRRLFGIFLFMSISLGIYWTIRALFSITLEHRP